MPVGSTVQSRARQRGERTPTRGGTMITRRFANSSMCTRAHRAHLVHRHPPIPANGHLSDTVVFPAGGPYRVVVDVYPQQTTPQPNFQLFSSLHVGGAYTPQPLPPFSPTQTVDGYTFTLHGTPNLH